MNHYSPDPGDREGKRQQAAQCYRELADTMFQIARASSAEIPGLTEIEKKRAVLLLLRAQRSGHLHSCFVLKLSSTNSEGR